MINLDVVNLQLKTRLQHMFLEIAKIKKHFSVEHHRTTSSNYSSINSSEEGLVNETVHFDAEIKTYQFEPAV